MFSWSYFNFLGLCFVSVFMFNSLFMFNLMFLFFRFVIFRFSNMAFKKKFKMLTWHIKMPKKYVLIIF